MHRTAFSYYGGKGMLAGRYPAPKHRTIVEPFAGAAAYSCMYFGHDVILIDKNEYTCAIWRFLQSDLANSVAKDIPPTVQPGDTVDDILAKMGGGCVGLEWFLRSAANVGISGTKKLINTITWIAAKNWKHNTIDKIRVWHGRIQHWRIICGSYTDAPNVEATWFVDPPYSNTAGSLYRHSAIDYSDLADFVHTRRGQIIVCENKGADWLEGFCQLGPAQGVKGNHISRSRAAEVMWYSDNTST